MKNEQAQSQNLPAGAVRSTRFRVFKNRFFVGICIASASAVLVVLAILLLSVALQGFQYLNGDFLTRFPSRYPQQAGFKSPIYGSIFICVICALTALPIGVGTAVLLEEFKPRNRVGRGLHGFISLNITNLAGVPSIVYGILGLTLFVFMFNAFGRGEAGWSFGAEYYDAYTDYTGKNTYFAPVDGKDASEVTLADGMTLLDDRHQPVRISLVSWDHIDELEGPILDRIDAKRAELEAAYVNLSANERYDRVNAELRRHTEEWMADVFTGIFPEDTERFGRTAIKRWYYFQLPFDRGVLAGGLTLMLVILPIVITASQEAIRAVPDSLREGALACGATRCQMVWEMTLPAAVPGIMTGSILALSRAIGEAAPILIIAGGTVFLTFTPQHLMDTFTAMPLQIYNWAQRPQSDFHAVAASGIIVLLAILLTFNAIAVLIRQKFHKPLN